jgi:hypothetical protein
MVDPVQGVNILKYISMNYHLKLQRHNLIVLHATIEIKLSHSWKEISELESSLWHKVKIRRESNT